MCLKRTLRDFPSEVRIMKKSALFKALLTFIGGPAAGAFGLWLIAEAPVIHRSICLVGGA